MGSHKQLLKRWPQRTAHVQGVQSVSEMKWAMSEKHDSATPFIEAKERAIDKTRCLVSTIAEGNKNPIDI